MEGDGARSDGLAGPQSSTHPKRALGCGLSNRASLVPLSLSMASHPSGHLQLLPHRGHQPGLLLFSWFLGSHPLQRGFVPV